MLHSERLCLQQEETRLRTLLPIFNITFTTQSLKAHLLSAGKLLAKTSLLTELFAQCKFSDCAHDREPGCAVRSALDDGTLPAERWDSYQKLQGELEHLERKLDKRAASEARKKWKTLSQDGRANMRLKGKP